MSQRKIIGRDAEKKILEQALQSSDPEFIAVFGRRRVGKTHLIREYFDGKIQFEIVGAHDADLSEQLDHFADAMERAAGVAVPLQRPASWHEAFQQLSRFLESTPAGKNSKRVLFFDELPWLNTPRSKFLSALEHFWNSWASRQNNLILVVCGSAASWMLQNIVRSRKGLHNRLTRQIRLLPFSLHETERFLRYRGVKLTRAQIVEIYLALGGVPLYLMQIETGLSATQAVGRACFAEQGLLRHEYEKLYASLFEDSEHHLKIIQALAAKHKGLTRNGILKAAAMPSGGSASRRLEELEESGFIQSYIPFDKTANDALYRLSDEFSLFHLDWIARLGKRSPGEGHWSLQRNSSRYRAWAGYAFEGLCMKHSQRIKNALGVANVETTEGPWRQQADSKTNTPGAQIDMLIDRRDDTINLCEMKHSESEFTIDARYARELRRKIEVFRQATNTRKNIMLTVITTHGVSRNAHFSELVDQSITVDDLF